MKKAPGILYSENSELEVQICYESFIDDRHKVIVTNCIVLQDEYFRSSDLYADVQLAISAHENIGVNEVSIPCEITHEVKEVNNLKSIAA